MNLTLDLIDFAAISPLLILLLGALSLIGVESFCEKTSKKYAFPISLFILVIALYATIKAPISQSPLLTPWLRFDSTSYFFSILFLTIGLATVCLSASFFKVYEATQGEYYFLLLSALFGLILIGAAADFLTLFIGLEILSISLYVWCGYMKSWELSHESAIKYFLMGALATSFLIYGIALLYGAVGSTQFQNLLSHYQQLSANSDSILFLAGIALVTLGLAFKAAIVPFHVWAPDVYAGAPTPVTAFMSVGTKAGAFAAFVVVFLKALPQFNPIWNEAVALLAYPTLIYANIVALKQVQLRRFFAYSGISHAGFLLIPLAAGTADAITAIEFYLVVYAFATLGAFAVLSFLDQKKEGIMIQDLHGLFNRSPLLASILALCLLTLAGIPPTAGFFAKFYIFKLAFQTGFYGLVFVGLLTTILAFFYYLRILAAMLTEGKTELFKKSFLWPATIVGLTSLLALLLLSFYPTPLLNVLAILNG